MRSLAFASILLSFVLSSLSTFADSLVILNNYGKGEREIGEGGPGGFDFSSSSWEGIRFRTSDELVAITSAQMRLGSITEGYVHLMLYTGSEDEGDIYHFPENHLADFTPVKVDTEADYQFHLPSPYPLRANEIYWLVFASESGSSHYYREGPFPSNGIDRIYDSDVGATDVDFATSNVEGLLWSVHSGTNLLRLMGETFDPAYATLASEMEFGRYIGAEGSRFQDEGSGGAYLNLQFGTDSFHRKFVWTDAWTGSFSLEPIDIQYT
jgi:hypothetical protein